MKKNTFARRNFLLLILLITQLATLAVPARRGLWKTLVLTDGTRVRAQLMGDEHLHYWRTADGISYMANENHKEYQIVTKSQWEKARLRRTQQRNTLRTKGKKAKATEIKGEKHGLIILVEFADCKFTQANPQQHYNDVVNTKGYKEGNYQGSVHDYFSDQSNGLFDLKFDVVGPISLSKSYKYYGEDIDGDEPHAVQMVLEACTKADEMVDYSRYDWNGDQEVEQVFILYAGHGQADYDDAGCVWPHQSSITAMSNDSYLHLFDGQVVNVYACSNELNYKNGENGIGTICHEFSHCLGLPDMYDLKGSNFGMGTWSIMDYGSYNGDGFIPCGFTAYEKMAVGWQEPTRLTANTQVEDMKPLSQNGETFLIGNKNWEDEYFLLENREREGWDRDLSGEGLLVTHVDYDNTVWQWNEVNTTTNALTGNDHPRCTVVPADNNLYVPKNNDEDSYAMYLKSMAGDPYPYGDNDKLNAQTKPAFNTYHDTENGERVMNCELSNIRRNSDGTMSFLYSTTPETPAAENDTVVFYETFNQCKGKGGNDNRFYGNLKGNFYPDNEGWSVAGNYCYGGWHCARFGTSKYQSIVSTPLIRLASDTTELTFRVAGWNTKAEDTTLILEISGPAKLSKDVIELSKGEWKDVNVKIFGKPGAQIKIIMNKENRFFLDEVKVVSLGKPTVIDGIKNVMEQDKSGRRKDHLIYSISGACVGNDLNMLPKGIYIRDGKKIIK